MSPHLSRYLDALRFGAALIVLLSHFAYARFTNGHFSFIREYNLGSDAVVIFFVLSGFVISFAAVEKDKTAKVFIFNRMTRLWSVAIPALILTLLCDKAGILINPAAYANSPFYAEQSAAVYWLKGLTFSTHWSSETLRLGTNGPYWSLSYEAAYYALFAMLMFSKGLMRIALILAAILVIGVNVMLLLPAWAMGAGLYFGLRRLKDAAAKPGVTTVMIVAPVLIYIACLAMGAPKYLEALGMALLGPYLSTGLGFANEFIWNGLIGVLFTVHLLGFALKVKSDQTKPAYDRPVKWLAGAGFSLYLAHYPILTLAAAGLPKTGALWADYAILLAVTIGACFIFAHFFERPIYKFRRAAKALLSLRLTRHHIDRQSAL